MKLIGYELYGGATVSRAIDGSGAEWIGCTARRNADQRFGFTLFREGVEVPYAPFCSGRGSISAQGHWIASDGKDYATGPIPGFVPFATIAFLQSQITALQQQLAGTPPTISNGVLRIGPQGAAQPLEGGQIELAAGDGGAPWVIDVRGANLRISRDGVVVQRWT